MKADNLYFILTNEASQKHKRQGIAMHIMAAIFILLYGIQYLPTAREHWMYLIALVPCSILIVCLSIFKKSTFYQVDTNRAFRILELGFIIMGALHFLQKNQHLPTILFLVTAIGLGVITYMEHRIQQEQYVCMSHKGIMIELPLKNKYIIWEEIRDVILRHDIFSIVLKNEQVLQYRIAPHTVSEEELASVLKTYHIK